MRITGLEGLVIPMTVEPCTPMTIERSGSGLTLPPMGLAPQERSILEGFAKRSGQGVEWGKWARRGDRG